MMAKWMRERASTVAAASACVLAERLRDDLRLVNGTELHNELSVILLTAIKAFLENLDLPQGTEP